MTIGDRRDRWGQALPPPEGPGSDARRHSLLHASLLFHSRALVSRLAEGGAGSVQLGLF